MISTHDICEALRSEALKCEAMARLTADETMRDEWRFNAECMRKALKAFFRCATRGIAVTCSRKTVGLGGAA